MGWGELDRPGSTCLERTQTHRTGLSGKEFKRAGRKGEKKAHIADARVKSVTPEDKPRRKGCSEISRNSGGMPSRDWAALPLSKRWGLAVSPRPPVYLLPQNSSD